MSDIKIISGKEYLRKNKKPNQERIWDSISDLWGAYKREPFFKVKEFLENKKGLIIDLGCGTGRNMIPGNFEYYVVDFSDNQLKAGEKITQERKINARFFKSESDNLSIFKDNMFDYGLFIATLHCIENFKSRENALKEFYRVLKPGSEALISVWNSEDKRFNVVNNHGDVYMSWKKGGKNYMRYYYLYSKDELVDLLKRIGFDIIEFSENDGINSSHPKDRFSKKNLIVKVRK